MVLGLSLILIVIIPYCIYLFIMNKKLNELLNKLMEEHRILLDRKITNSLNKDILPMTSIEENNKATKKDIHNNEDKEIKEKNQTEKEIINKDKTEEEHKIKNINHEEKTSSKEKIVNKTTTKPQTNNLENNSQIKKEIITKQPSKSQNRFNVKEFVRNYDARKKVMSQDYLEELADQLIKNEKGSPVELTEYEKEQETNAIISYQELKSKHGNQVKDNNVVKESKENQNNKPIKDMETEDFIEKLKEFRDNLDSE